jgi:hypothetical protein
VKLEANDLVMVLLCNLPKSYINLIIAPKSREKVDLNIEFVKIRHLHVELMKDVESSSNEVSILVVCTSKATLHLTTLQHIKRWPLRGTRKKIIARNLSIGFEKNVVG